MDFLALLSSACMSDMTLSAECSQAGAMADLLCSDCWCVRNFAGMEPLTEIAEEALLFRTLVVPVEKLLLRD